MNLRVFLTLINLGVVLCVGPLVSDGWTPVVGSKNVRLPSGYVEKPNAPVRVSQENPSQINSRVDREEQIIQILEKDGVVAQEQEVGVEVSLNTLKEESNVQQKNEVAPLIIYPEGSHPASPPTKAPRPPPQRLPVHPRIRHSPHLLSRQAPPPPQHQAHPPHQGHVRPRPPNRRPPPHKRPPPRGPPPPKGGIASKIAGIGGKIKCLTEDVAADYRLSDKSYMQAQIKCVLNEGPCDNIGVTIKRMAPEIMRGLCPYPCNQCKKKQIQKIMAVLSKDYPYEWAQMIKIFG